jgi:hypothetical protein
MEFATFAYTESGHAQGICRAAQRGILYCWFPRFLGLSGIRLRGESPEGIAESFPALGLEQIFGALAFYMANRKDVDRYLSEGKQEFEAMRQQAQLDHPALYAKLDKARRRTHTPTK